jgi:DNA-binding XRE family transcriptional regulator
MRAHYRWWPGDPRPENFWDIGRRFKALRKKRGFTQKGLGQHINLCRQSVSEIENGHVVCHKSTWLTFREYERLHYRKQPDLDRFMAEIKLEMAQEEPAPLVVRRSEP